MARKLITVEHVFNIVGWGVGLSPVAVPQGDEVFRAHDPIDIKLSDGTVLRTEVARWSIPTPNPESGLNIMLQPPWKKEDIPVGAEVWSVDR